MAAKLKVKVLSAAVRVKQLDASGKEKQQLVGYGVDAKPILEPATKLVFLSRGDDLPDHLAAGEVERLKQLDAVGTAKEVERFGDGVRSSAPTPEVSAEPAGGGDPETLALDKLGEYEQAQLNELWKAASPKVADVIAAVGDDKELAQKALDAEKFATSGDARSTLKSGLEKVLSAEPAGGGDS
jgi:hypothetical protein